MNFWLISSLVFQFAFVLGFIAVMTRYSADAYQWRQAVRDIGSETELRAILKHEAARIAIREARDRQSLRGL